MNRRHFLTHLLGAVPLAVAAPALLVPHKRLFRGYDSTELRPHLPSPVAAVIQPRYIVHHDDNYTGPVFTLTVDTGDFIRTVDLTREQFLLTNARGGYPIAIPAHWEVTHAG